MNTLKILEYELWRHLNAIGFDSSGSPIEVRKLFGRIGSIKIEIYPKEHRPAHFHASGPDLEVCFEIPGCKILQGFKVPKSDTLSKIRQFYHNNEALIIEVWNQTRPENCQVGKVEIQL